MLNKSHLAGILAVIILISGLTSAGSMSYVHGANGQLIAKINETNITYYHSDHLGSSSVMTDKEGKVTFSADYLPFGSQFSGSGFEKYQFTGKEFDSDLGLNYFGARYYSPLTGRFFTVDPAKDGVNWFAYGNNNPLRYTDPTGMRATPLRRMRDPTGDFIIYVAEKSRIPGLIRKVDRGIKKGILWAKKGIEEFPASISNRISYGVYIPDKRVAIKKFQQRSLEKRRESLEKRLRNLEAYIENAEEWYNRKYRRGSPFKWRDADYPSRFKVLCEYTTKKRFISKPEMNMLVVGDDTARGYIDWLKEIGSEVGIRINVHTTTDYFPEDKPENKYLYDLIIKPDIVSLGDGSVFGYDRPDGSDLMMSIELMDIETQLIKVMSIEIHP